MCAVHGKYYSLGKSQTFLTLLRAGCKKNYCVRRVGHYHRFYVKGTREREFYYSVIKIERVIIQRK